MSLKSNIKKNDIIFWKGHVAIALSKNKLTDLLAQKDTLIREEANWKQFKKFAEHAAKLEKSQTELLENKKVFVVDLKTTSEKIKVKKAEIDTS
mgnify:CR=1 FL=1